MGLKHGNKRRLRRDKRQHIEREIFASFEDWPHSPRHIPRANSPARRHPNAQEVSR